MSFPTSPTNGQTAIVNGINYVYSLSDNTWTIVPDSLIIQLDQAFDQANAAFDKANGAAIAANTPSHVANSAALYANGSFIHANSGFIQANAAFNHANAAFNVANTASGADQVARNTANSAFIQANAAFDSTNTTAIFANTPSHVANSAAIYANGAFTKANTDVTTITVASPGVYGNGTIVPVITVEANGRVSSVANVTITGGGSTYTYTASVNPPASPDPGDHWYSTGDDVLYEYINDGTSDYWVDITSSAVSVSNTVTATETFSPFLLAGM